MQYAGEGHLISWAAPVAHLNISSEVRKFPVEELNLELRTTQGFIQLSLFSYGAVQANGFPSFSPPDAEPPSAKTNLRMLV